MLHNFHALQNVQDSFKEAYGANYPETHPEAEALKEKIYRLFDAKTKRTAQKLYRFTPFSQDAQPRIRSKCPLELAGYDISRLPMSSLCAGLSVIWPLEVAQDHVPNS
jgi:hypothetical protein